MLPTYPAYLRDNRLEWTGESPPATDRPIPVHVTLLAPNATPIEQGRRMAEALEKLATSALAQIEDPQAWEREQREERELPGRES
jgi:hypothetical protein